MARIAAFFIGPLLIEGRMRRCVITSFATNETRASASVDALVYSRHNFSNH